MDTQFYHEQSDGRYYRSFTVAMDLPNKEEFAKLISNEKKQITLKVGTAICSYKDNFEYKKGRELSSSRMDEEVFILRSIRFDGPKSQFIFINLDPTSDVQDVTLRMNDNSERLYLIQVNMSDIIHRD